MSGVDVVVPCYNYGRYLEWCAGTLLNQAGVSVRVLIIDDGSGDDTPGIGERLAARDSRIEFRRHPRNAGHIATYNEGLLDWASAKYSLLISADDGLAPGALARATQLMDAHPQVGMAYGRATIITDDPAPGPAPSADPGYRIVNTARFLERCCQVGNPVPSPTAVVRTELQQRLGGYRDDLPHSGDMEMWMRFALNGAVGVLGAVQGYYRWHGRNMSAAYFARRVGDLRERVLAFRPLEAQLRAAVPEFPAWLTSMCDRLGSEALWMAHDAFESGDDEGYRECLAFAAEVHSSLRRSSVWKRLRVKQLLGRRAVRGLRPVLSWLRGETASTDSPRTGGGYRPGTSIGWWPTDQS